MMRALLEHDFIAEHHFTAGIIAGLIAFACFFRCFLILLARLRTLREQGLQIDIRDRLRSIGWHSLVPSVFIGVAVTILLWWLSGPSDTTYPGSLSNTIREAGTIVAAGYFAYQVMAGAQFATTSIAIQGVRSPTDPSKILVTATITRGDNWLAVIVVDAYSIETGQGSPPRWQAIGFPRRKDDSLRLGPKEQTSTTFVIDQAPPGDVTITALVESYSILWPVAAQSFAKTTVLAAESARDGKFSEILARLSSSLKTVWETLRG